MIFGSAQFGFSRTHTDMVSFLLTSHFQSVITLALSLNPKAGNTTNNIPECKYKQLFERRVLSSDTKVSQIRFKKTWRF
jgi:hypothetical protein